MTRAISRLSAAVLAAAMLLTLSQSSQAFCRTHTCNPANPKQQCSLDDHVPPCVTNGIALSWPSTCISFSIQQDGSLKYGIDAATLGSMVQTAFDRWTQADCSTAPESGTAAVDLRVVETGTADSCAKGACTVACDTVEFNLSGANANIWMFRDDVWPYVGGEDALGLSTVHYNPDTGEIQDVDVELNGADTPLSVDTPASGADLDSIITHEAGHFLGLSHTWVAGSTMQPGYTSGDDSLRTLELDDVAGICAAYPSGRTVASMDCAPRRGLASECGGALAPSPSSGASTSGGCALGTQRKPVAWWSAVVLLGLAALRRRKR